MLMSGASFSFEDAPRSSDGGIILQAAPMRTGDYEYYGFELPGSEDRGIEWDQLIIGRIEQADMKKTLGQFKGLPLTDEHVFVNVGERRQSAVGTILSNGKVDGELVRTEALVHEPKAILKIQNGKAEELSIGFHSAIEWVENKTDGDPDFFVRDIDLNHVAIVKQGRAGPEARLSNHKAELKRKGENMKTIKIDGKDYQVEDAVAQEFSRLADQTTTLNNSVASITTERDTARGETIAANQALENARGEADANAIRVANAHASLVNDAKTMGHDKDLVLGQYDEVKLKKSILENAGFKFSEDDSDDVVRGAWKNAVHTKAAAQDDTSELDDVNTPKPKQTFSARESAENAVSNSMFGKNRKAKKPKKTEE